MVRPSSYEPDNTNSNGTHRRGGQRRLPGRGSGTYVPDADMFSAHPGQLSAGATGTAAARAAADRPTRRRARTSREPRGRDLARTSREGRDRQRGSASLRDLVTGDRATADRLRPSDATVSRIGATVLWVLVILAAYGGITALLGSGTDDAAAGAPSAPSTPTDGRWTAAGLAERYVTAYLLASNGEELAPFLGYNPELPVVLEPVGQVGEVRTVSVAATDSSTGQAIGEPDGTDGTGAEAASGTDGESSDATPGPETDYWSVTVAVTDQHRVDDGDDRVITESFWQVAVDTSGDQPVAVGLPAPVAAPATAEQADPAISLNEPSPDDPQVDSVEGFLAAYLCGAPDLDRYLQPGAELQPADPPICSRAEVLRWGVDTEIGEADAGAQIALAEVALTQGQRTHQATYSFMLAERDGRWEVADLLPAPPLEQE